MDKLVSGVEADWKALEEVFDILAGGDVPKDALSDIKTEEFCIPILSNGIGDKSLYGWTNKAKIVNPSLTISARGTIGWTSFRDKPFFPIVRLLVLTPKVEVNLKYAYHFMKMIENDYKTPKTGIPQLTKPMIKDIKIPIPCPENPEKSLEIQAEIARILDTFTEITAELTAELAARKKQYTYYRDQLLTFKDGEVEWKKMKDVVKIKNGKDWKKLGAGDIPVYGSGGIMKYVDKFAYDKPTVLIPRKGSITNIFYVETPIWNVDTIYYTEIDVNQLIPKFFYHYMKTIDLMKLDTGSGRPSLTQAILNEINIPIPLLGEQAHIVSILDKFDALTFSITEGLPREIELRQKQYEYYRNMLLSFPKEGV